MSGTPLLSVVTATFNRAPSLLHCFSSVLAFYEAISPIEHIIVDNMSSDGTAGIVEEYSRSAPYEVRYIREPDFGIYDALNKGIKHARGNYIHLLHSDDAYADPGMIGDLARYLEAETFDVIACAIRYRKEANVEATVWEPSYRKRFRQCRFPHTGCVVKRAFYDSHGVYDTRFRIISDALYIANVFPSAKFVMLPVVLVEMATTGISSRDSLRLRFEQLALLLRSNNLPLYYKVKRAPVMLLRVLQYLVETRFSDLELGLRRTKQRRHCG